jgi:hypothetical protein
MFQNHEESPWWKLIVDLDPVGSGSFWTDPNVLGPDPDLWIQIQGYKNVHIRNLFSADNSSEFCMSKYFLVYKVGAQFFSAWSWDESGRFKKNSDTDPDENGCRNRWKKFNSGIEFQFWDVNV